MGPPDPKLLACAFSFAPAPTVPTIRVIKCHWNPHSDVHDGGEAVTSNDNSMDKTPS